MYPAPLRTPANLGALIKQRRLELGLDQAALARKVGVSRLWINQIERGKPGAGVGLVLRTLMAMGIELRANERAEKAVPPASPDLDAIIAAARADE